MGARLRAIFQHWRWFVFACVLVCSGCASNPVRDYCAVSEPIRLTKAEIKQLSDDSAKQILTANETRAKLCGK